ncbi:MAG TPA: metallophosphoesterase family protein [Gaiellaceae bacterium]|nr:metallophosphoesterase family protein [Gaiellaceae bacterium]
MKVAALYDVHGMPWALEAVLNEVDADVIVFGGDLTGPPFHDETVALARTVDAIWIRGNGEDVYDEMRDLPLSVELDGVAYCHATPSDNTTMTTAITPDEDLVSLFGERGTFVIGHTHHQFDRRIGDLRVINAGSVGMPYEGEVAAFWALITDGEPQFMRTPIDVDLAVARIRKSGWDGGDAFIAENLLVAVTRDEAINHFEANR